MFGPDETRPATYNGIRTDGAHFLRVITELLKEHILDLGGPDIGPTAPFLTDDEWATLVWSPELIERVTLMYKLTLRTRVC